MLNKNLAILFSLGASMASAQAIVRQPVNASGVTQVHTALEHLSIITLPEKIIRVAAGSDAAQIEWHDNSVFIKPVKNGQATNLMVWTEHQFSAYELEAPGPVSEMTFVLDESKSPVPEGTANPESGGKGRGRGTATHYRVDYRLDAPRCHTRCCPRAAPGKGFRKRPDQSGRTGQELGLCPFRRDQQQLAPIPDLVAHCARDCSAKERQLSARLEGFADLNSSLDPISVRPIQSCDGSRLFRSQPGCRSWQDRRRRSHLPAYGRG